MIGMAPGRGHSRFVLGGYALVAVSFLIWGAIGALVRYSTMPVSALNVFRMVIGALIVGALFARRETLAEVRRADVWPLVLLMGAFSSSTILLFFLAMRLADVAIGMFLLFTSPVYVALLTPEYTMPFANSTFRKWFGYDPDKKCHEFLFNRTEPCDGCETYKALKTNQPHHWEWTGPNGRNYSIFDFPFKDTDGSQLIMEMGIDVTEQRQAEAAIRELNATLEQRVAERTVELRASQEDLSRAQAVAHNSPHLIQTSRGLRPHYSKARSYP